MFYAVMYFNLKDGVSEEEFKEKAKGYYDYVNQKVEGVGAFKIFRHYFFGENRRSYQLWCEFDDFHAVEREKEAKEDPEVERRLKEVNDLIDMKEHIDELVIDVSV